MKINQFSRLVFLRMILAFAAVVVATLAWASPPEGVLDETHASVRAVMAVQREVTPGLMVADDVLGTAAGVDNNGEPALVVYVDRDGPAMASVVKSLPPHMRGVGVRVELTDKFLAFAAHTARQTPPIQLGTSGGWAKDLANGYCCGGTLGSLIQVNGVQYILSNYHVFESDTVPGGNGIVAATGDPIIQPGLIDVGCSAAKAQVVGTLVKLSSLPNNNVDCSVAQVVPSMVSANGAILEVGTLSAQTRSAALKLAVKKSGRTSGLTTSTVSGLNATIRVTYENECAGGTAFTKTFTGQIVITSKGGKFLQAGDSGSLLVENAAIRPRAVGLLYAGSSSSAIANPISEVLLFVGGKLGGTATMVGN
jgi:hypothetical protein